MKNKSYIMVIIATLIVFAIGGTYAFFQVLGGGTETKNVNVQTYTTDLFTTNVTDEILLTADQSDFYQNAGNKTASTTASARLLPNSKTGTATEHYNVYVVIDTNNFVYTTQNNTAEIILTVTDPEGNPAGSITGLNSVTPGVFDITTRTGAFKVAEDYEITTDSAQGTTQEWSMTVTLVNLDTDQNDNTNKTLSGTIYITKENMETYSLAELNGIRTSHLNEQTGELESNIRSTSVTVEAQTTEGSEGIGTYYFGIEETNNSTGYIKTENKIVDGVEYFESETSSYTFTGLKDETEYTVYSFVEDRAGFRSNIYTTNITTIEYILPTVNNVETEILDLHRIKLTATSSAGENSVSKYYFNCGNGWSEAQDSNEYVCSGLTYNTNYTFKVKVIDTYGKYSVDYDKPAVIENYQITCSAGEYLAANSEVCVACPAGSYCPGGTYTYDTLAHGSTLCSQGSYSNNGASACTACSGGYTNSGTGNTTACTTTCSNNANVASWKTPSWNNDNTISDLCAAATCSSNSFQVSGNNCVQATYYIYWNIPSNLDGSRTVANNAVGSSYLNNSADSMTFPQVFIKTETDSTGKYYGHQLCLRPNQGTTYFCYGYGSWTTEADTLSRLRSSFGSVSPTCTSSSTSVRCSYKKYTDSYGSYHEWSFGIASSGVVSAEDYTFSNVSITRDVGASAYSSYINMYYTQSD